MRLWMKILEGIRNWMITQKKKKKSNEGSGGSSFVFGRNVPHKISRPYYSIKK